MFSATIVTAIWVRENDKTAPLGYYLVPRMAQVIPMKAKNWPQAEKELKQFKAKQDPTSIRKVWAYGPNAENNCRLTNAKAF